MQKVDQIKAKLSPIFPDAKIRNLGQTIRFNVDTINDDQLNHLSLMSTHDICEVKVKRSGTGLLIVVNV